jgi:hypothetical protein
MVRKNLLILLALLGVMLALVAGCGGGGGGGGGSTGTTVSILGRIIWIENGGAPSPQATVRIGERTTLTNTVDGGFNLDVPSGAASLTVSTTIAGTPIIRTFNFPAAAASVDLGDLFIGPTEVSITGRVVDSTNGTGVAGARVSIAGRTAVAAANGTFTVTQVAYSSTSLSVFLGLQGTASGTSYFTGFFSPPAGAVGGVVDAGSISLVPTGGDSPPPLPTNLTVTVAPSGSSSTVEVLLAGTVIRTGTADAAGKASFWLPAGTYTVRATKAAQIGTAPVTITTPSSQTSVNVTLS